MIKYEGMKAEENKSESFGQLPVGAYVGYCLDAKIEGSAPDQSLVLALDVNEGEHANFFVMKYQAAKQQGSKYGEVKYKGTYRLRIPNPANSNAQYPELDKRTMNDMIWRFEQSNPGFRWDGDETKLKGLKVGFSTQEDSYNGNTFTRIGRLESVDAVRAGTVQPMKPRKRNNSPSVTTIGTDPMPQVPTYAAVSPAPMDTASGMPIVDEELPF